MDDTRDIAIRAQASSHAAHHRLDGINGQIGRLATAVEKTNEKLDADLNHPETGLRAEIAAMKSDVRVAMVKIAIVVGVLSVFGTAASYAAVQEFVKKATTPASAIVGR